MDPKDLGPYVDKAVHAAQDVAEEIDRTVHQLSSFLRRTLSNSDWIPESARPSPPSSNPFDSLSRSRSSLSLWARTSSYAKDHPVLTSFVVSLGLSWSAYYVKYKIFRWGRKKRRARRASNGARKEVVIIAGSMHEPLARALVLDLERRGFIVFVVVSSMEEERMVQTELSQSRSDIRPLRLDPTDSDATTHNLAQLHTFLTTPHRAAPTFEQHHMSLSGLILFPPPSFPTGPLETLAPSRLSDTLNTKLLSPLLTTQQLLPLLRGFRASLILMTQSVTTSIQPAFHAPEVMVGAAWDAWGSVLEKEVGASGVSVYRFRLGAIEVPNTPGSSRPAVRLNTSTPRTAASPARQITSAATAEILSWSYSVRQAYARAFKSSQNSVGGFRGGSMRDLCIKVFECLEKGEKKKKKSGVVYCGKGARMYDVLGAVGGVGLVQWMVGRAQGGRRLVEEEGWEKI